jgi:hypothetical protein
MRRAGYASDSVPDELQKDQHLEDHLGMKREVEALSWVVAARDVDPPLSVGLFGDWGSGKSYFMRLMVEQVKGIAKDAQAEEAAQAKDKTRPKFPAYPHIRQITFNAWHYVDANLWASLVTYIFEELARPGGRQPDQEVEHLLGQLQTTQLLTQEAEARKAQAQAERRQRTEELEKVKRQRMGRVKELEQGRVRHPAILTDEDVRGRATKLAEQSPRSDRPPLRPSEVVDLADGAAQVMKDPELLRRSMELVPDDDARRRLLDLADDPAVRDGLSDLAADRATVGQLAQLVGDPQFRQSAIDLIPDEERRQDVAELTTQLLQIYADVLSLGKAAADLRTTRGKLGYLWRSLRAAWSWKRLLASLMVLVAGVGLGIYLFRDRGLTLQGLVSVLVGTAAFLRLSVPVVQRSIGAVRSAADLAADAVDEPARRQIELLEAQETQLQREVEEARRQEYAAERELEEIRQGRRLYRYIEERASSSDYRQYLGVIALVRRDFERLAELMDQARTAQEDAAAAETASDAGDGPAQSLPRIDRVILYIDDLDRCPATRVVEVLEAVHLLLALKLFVVVVGVDSRWLVRSLQRHYRAQLSGEEPERPGVEDDRSEWQTTPQNYLEKIFQIAFSIRPMDRKGYEALLDALFRTTTAGDGQRAGNDGHPAGQDTAASPPPVAPASTPEVAGPPDQPGRRADGPAAAPAAPAASTEEAMPDPVDTDQDERLAKTDHPPRPSPTDDPEPAHGTTDPSGASAKASAKNAARAREALLITGEELRFMKRLAPFVPTPRSTKRLANTYRLLRVLVTGEEAAEFGPDKHESGHYRVALTLLAILIGFPRQATTLFGDLLSATDEDWPAFRRRLRGDRTPARADDLEATKGPAERDEGQSWERLLQCVDRLAADTDLPENLGPYKYWCQRVARYSFQTGRLAMLAGSDSDTAVVASGGPQLTTPSAPSANSSGRSRSGKLPPST